MLTAKTRGYVRTMLQEKLNRLVEDLAAAEPAGVVLDIVAEIQTVSGCIAEVLTEEPAAAPQVNAETRSALHLYKNVMACEQPVRDLELKLGLDISSHDTHPHRFVKDLRSFIEREKRMLTNGSPAREVAMRGSTREHALAEPPKAGAQ
jgi:hypothetical protein